MYCLREKKGFTMLEVLLTLSSIAVIAGIGIPIYQSFQVRNDLDIATATVTQSMRQAQMFARASAGDSDWGVFLSSDNIVIFKGDNFSSRDTSFDEVFGLPNSITPSGQAEIVFSKFTGLPETIGTINLASNINEERNLIINEKGTINF